MTSRKVSCRVVEELKDVPNLAEVFEGRSGLPVLSCSMGV